MPTLSVSLPDELERFIAAQVEAGHYANPNEVMTTALRALEQSELQQEEHLVGLRAAIDEGDASPDAEDGVFERIRKRYGLPLQVS